MDNMFDGDDQGRTTMSKSGVLDTVCELVALWMVQQSGAEAQVEAYYTPPPGSYMAEAGKALAALRASGFQVIEDAPDHTVEFTKDRWAIEHSVQCRIDGDLLDCAYNRAITRITANGFDPDLLGRWRIVNIDSEGLPSLERV